MRKTLLAAAAIAAMTLGVGTAKATTVGDPVGDFRPSFIGPFTSDLDVTSFTVDLDRVANAFDLSATFAGPLDTSKANLYVIGVNTGTGVIQPFADIGEPKVIFNQALIVHENGVVTLGANTLSPAIIAGNGFSLVVPTSAFTSTGFAPRDFQFNLWPRTALTNNNQISDFAPQNATIAALPEPAAWALMIGGFGLAGARLRARRRVQPA
ncbi:MAG: PEPxxWA-CTERM sorting domain-containing protein [Phenylobacterium sp.]